MPDLAIVELSYSEFVFRISMALYRKIERDLHFLYTMPRKQWEDLSNKILAQSFSRGIGSAAVKTLFLSQGLPAFLGYTICDTLFNAFFNIPLSMALSNFAGPSVMSSVVAPIITRIMQLPYLNDTTKQFLADFVINAGCGLCFIGVGLQNFEQAMFYTLASLARKTVNVFISDNEYVDQFMFSVFYTLATLMSPSKIGDNNESLQQDEEETLLPTILPSITKDFSSNNRDPFFSKKAFEFNPNKALLSHGYNSKML